MKRNKRTQRTTEHYWAVRIGIPGKHLPYFKLCEESSGPALFDFESQAKVAAAACHGPAKVVRVTLKEDAQ